MGRILLLGTEKMGIGIGKKFALHISDFWPVDWHYLRISAGALGHSGGLVSCIKGK